MRGYSFKRTILASIISSFIAGTAFSAAVRDDVDYQYFRDFAENKGKFAVGAMNVQIFNKNNALVGTMFPNIPMLDLSSTDRNTGITTAIDPQYLVSVEHNVGYADAQFGGQGNHPEAHHYTYRIVDRNNYPHDLNGLDGDYHLPRVHKLITEIIPSPIVQSGLDNNIYRNKNRFPAFARVGSGTQINRNDNTGQLQHISGAYHYLIGGAPFNVTGNRYAWIDAGGKLNENVYGPLITYGMPGDSGSSIWAFDNDENRWLHYGVLNFAQDDRGTANTWSITRKDWNEQTQAEDNLILINQGSSQLSWRKNGSASSTITDNNALNLAVDLNNPDLPSSANNSPHIPSLNYGKTVYFSGTSGTLTLEETINQGAGALYFETDFNVQSAQNDITWQGAGISIAKGKQVNWKVKNPQGDRLSKIGKGTLYINGIGENDGDISIGDGTVIFDQQADENQRKQAFKRVGIVSGRPTLILNSADQVNPDNIYFGFRGGRLDTNGNDLQFSHIQNVDEGAMIVNHNATTSNITITNRALLTQDQLQINDRVYPNQDLYFWQKNANERDYFFPTNERSSHPYYPINQQSSEHWQYIGSNREQAVENALERANQRRLYAGFNGFFGETDPTKPNGKLNIKYSPASEQHLLLLSGGTNLNGKLSIEKGSLVLSGRPTPHAYDYLKYKEVIYDNDWIDRSFNATHIAVNNANLFVGRNVRQVNADFSASKNAKLHLGLQQGVTPECIRSDATGLVQCETKNLSEQAVNSSPISAINSNIQLNDNSQLNLSRSILTGTIQGESTSSVTLHKESQWILNNHSTVGNLVLNEGSIIKLNHQSTIEDDQFHNLTVNGHLSGNGHFQFSTNITKQLGDQIVVNGVASGTHKFLVANTGSEPRSTLTLLTLNTNQPTSDQLNVSLANENESVDLGAFRYQLVKEKNHYVLALADQQTQKGSSVKVQPRPEIQFEKGASTTKPPLPEVQFEKGTSTTAQPLPEVLFEKGTATTAQPLPEVQFEKGTATTTPPLPEVQFEKGTATTTPHLPEVLFEKGAATTAQPLPEVLFEKGAATTTQPLPEVQFEKGTATTAQPLPEVLFEKGVSITDPDLPEIHLKNGKGVKTQSLPTADLKNFLEKSKNTSVVKHNSTKQNRIISRYSNGGLSEISTQVNGLLQINDNLHQAITTTSQDGLKVWTKAEQQKTIHSSDNYRAYNQQLKLTQLGVEKGWDNQFSLGLVLSNSHTSGDFDDQISQKGRFTQVAVYGKKAWQNGVFASIDGSYGKARNRLTHQEKTKFSRHIVGTGITLGKHWDLSGWEVSPAVAVRYARLSAVNYQFDGANINVKPLNLLTYQAGIKVGRRFQMGSFQLRPELSSQFIDTSHNKTKVAVNGHQLNQSFGRYVRNQLGLTLKKSNWELTLAGGLQHGNEVKKQRIASLKFGYNW